jgi:ribosome-associated protein
MSRAGDTLVVNDRVRVPLSEFSFSYARSSGPGGQNVNKVNSKVQLRWRPSESNALPADVSQRFLARNRNRLTEEGDFLITSQRFRDQPRNRQDCLERLADLLREASTPPKRRRRTKPTRGSRERRLSEKRQRSDRKRQRQRLSRDE